MNKKSRRNVLKGFAVSLPAAWAVPVVESVVLPAHAGVSGCSAEPGCYEGIDTSSGRFTVMWPGECGARENVDYWEGDGDDPRNCVGNPTNSGPMAVAENPDEARELLGCTGAGLVLELAVVNSNLSIWECCNGCPDSE